MTESQPRGVDEMLTSIDEAPVPENKWGIQSRGTTLHFHSRSFNSSPANRSLMVKGLDIIKTILLVEEEAVLRELLAEVLVSNGYRVFAAKDGEQAARMFSRYHSVITLVLSDIHLSKLGGDQLFRIMKRIDPEVQVIFEGVYFDADLKSRLLKAGVKGFIQKPQVPAEILAKINDVLMDPR